MTEPILEFKDFSFTYSSQKNPTLKNINFSVQRGEKILIAGPSGCGKSTLVNCINGLIPHALGGELKGSLKICGMSTVDSDIYKISRKVGTVLQDTDAQFVAITVAEDIAFALENQNKNLDEMEKTVLEMAKVVSMEKFLSQSPQELSGGQKQRVSLAGVLVDAVDVLVFDEPLANLDPATGEIAIELIDRIHRETGKTILIIEHRLEDVLYRPVDRIVVMQEGRIVKDDTPENLLRSNTLNELGVREPLFLAALKEAGCNLDEIPSISDSKDLKLTTNNKKKLADWAQNQKLHSQQTNPEKIVELENINFSYDGITKVLQNVSFSIHKGEMVSLLGNNGAGKSTLAQIMMGINVPSSGIVKINGINCLEDTIAQRAKTIGYVMQDPNHMISHDLIYDEIAFALRQKEINEEEIEIRVKRILKICGLLPFRKWPVSALSYGQKKRVTIASILVTQPSLLILDEPTSGQDYRHYSDLMEFLVNLNKLLGITILFITHDMHLALEYTTRSLVLSDGVLLADKKTSEVFSDPKLLKRANLKETSLYTLAFVADIKDARDFIAKFIQSEEKTRQKSNIKIEKLPETKENIKSIHKVKKVKEGQRKFGFALSYIDVNSPIHKLNGVTKFLFFVGWIILCLSTFDIRILGISLFVSLIAMRLCNIPFRTFRTLIIAMLYVVTLNSIFIYLFSPSQGTIYIGSRTVLIGGLTQKYSLTLEMVWYLLIISLKYFTIFPIALVFVSCTHPSEFSCSLNRIGLNYRISFSVGLALRYLPEVTSTFVHIMHAQMARGVDISKNVKLSKRIKNVSRVLGPLVLSSMDRIDIITQALILRGFCREPKRTWYKKKPLKFTDWLIIIVLFLWVGISFVSRFYFKVKFWYPFN